MGYNRSTLIKPYNSTKFSKFFITLIFVFIMAIPLFAWANDFGSAFKAAQSAFPPYPIFGGIGGAWVAVPYPASDNPACTAIFFENKKKFSFYTNPNWIHFNNGPETRVLISGLMFPLYGGGLKLSYVDINSGNAATKMEFIGKKLDLDMKVKQIRISYGRKIHSKIYLGISFSPWIDGDIRFKHERIISVKSENEIGINIKPGVLYQPLKGWYLGLIFNYAEDKTHTNATFFPSFVTPIKLKSKVESISRIWRLGTAWQPRRGTLLAFDWQVGEIDSRLGKYDINMTFMGVEQYLCENFAIRAGYLDEGLTLGAGFLNKNLSIQYAYNNESLQDLQPYTGSSSTHLISISIFF
ncbi:MAG: hypothetical protein JRE20_00035 [Deltaproteobacteria bacterium]|nr:hypothetical protein [Deltaproteobacteria bacterium]